MAEIFRRFSGIRVSHFMGMCVGTINSGNIGFQISYAFGYASDYFSDERDMSFVGGSRCEAIININSIEQRTGKTTCLLFCNGSNNDLLLLNLYIIVSFSLQYFKEPLRWSHHQHILFQ